MVEGSDGLYFEQGLIFVRLQQPERVVLQFKIAGQHPAGDMLATQFQNLLKHDEAIGFENVPGIVAAF